MRFRRKDAARCNPEQRAKINTLPLAAALFFLFGASLNAALLQSPRAAAQSQLVIVPPAGVVISTAATSPAAEIAAVPQYQDRGVVRLGWSLPADASVVGVRLKYGTVSGVYPNFVALGLVTNASFNTLLEATTYYFVAVTYNAAGVESSPSNEATVTTATHLEIRPKVFAVDFRARPGSTNVFQTSADLRTWQSVQTNIGTGQILTVERTNNGASEFVRIKP